MHSRDLTYNQTYNNANTVEVLNTDNIFLFNKSAFLLTVLVNFFVAINVFVLGSTGGVITFIYFLIFTIFFFNNDKILYYLLFISIVTSNFFTGDFFNYNFADTRTETITVDISQAISYALILIIILKNKVRYLLHINNIGTLLIIFILYCLFTSTFAEFFDTAFKNSLRLISFFVLYLLTVYYVRTEKNYIEFLNLVVATTLFIVLIIPLKLIFNQDQRYYGGSYFLLMMPLLCSVLAYIILKSKKINFTDFVFYAGLNVLCIVAMIFTYSRRYFIAFTIYIIGFLIAIRSKLVSLKALAVLGIGILVFVSLPGQLFFRIDDTFDTIESSFESGESGKLTESSNFFTNRNVLFDYGFRIFLEYPITGCGFLNSNKIIEQFTGTELRIHNLYLQLLADLGLIGFSIYTIIVIIIFIKLVSAYKYFASTGNVFMKLQVFAFILYFISICIIAFLGLHVIYSKFDWIVYGLVTAIFDNIIKNEIKEKRLKRQSLAVS